MAIRIRYAQLRFHVNHLENQKIIQKASQLRCTEGFYWFDKPTNDVVFVYYFQYKKVVNMLYRIVPFKTMWDIGLNKKDYDRLKKQAIKDSPNDHTIFDGSQHVEELWDVESQQEREIRLNESRKITNRKYYNKSKLNE
jgi:hypothetical protein